LALRSLTPEFNLDIQFLAMYFDGNGLIISFMPRAKKSVAPPIIVTEPVTPAVPVYAGPSPAVLEMQSDIVSLVRERSGYRKLVADAQAELFLAQSKFQATQGRLTQFEQEINERMTLIAQLENRAPAPQLMPEYNQGNVYSIGGNLQGISVEPARPSVNAYQADPNDLVNRGHIDSRQAAAMRAVL